MGSPGVPAHAVSSQVALCQDACQAFGVHWQHQSGKDSQLDPKEDDNLSRCGRTKKASVPSLQTVVTWEWMTERARRGVF
eukprot:2105877-Amphidinium_carterae.1